MSAALVRQALEIVDPSISTTKKSKKKGVFGLVPENQKIIHKSKQKHGKVQKSNLLSAKTKLTVAEARKSYKPKEVILQENLKKLELIREASKIELRKEVTEHIIERGVTNRPIKANVKSKSKQKTAFTEEDFKKFEEEYFGDD